MTDTPNRPPLSPAAQAVRDAAFSAYDEETLYRATGEQHAGIIAAAALQAAVATGGHKTPGGSVILDDSFLLAIAAELEAHHE